jgi:hypothetical protein
MKYFILLSLLFFTVFCGDYRKPTRAQRNCFVKNIGEEETKKLIISLRKYHRTNGKATLLDYILDKRTDLKNIADECLLKIKRRLDKISDDIDKAFQNQLVDYYMKAILRDERVKSEIINDLKVNKNFAVKSCSKHLNVEDLCALIIDKILQKLEKEN